MEYLNIKLETVGDIRYVGSRPLVRATWLNLLIYCVKQENSGRIANCSSWGDDTWAQIAGLRRKEVHADSQLWDWDGSDLVVWAYPLHNEHVCRVRRDIGRAGGRASGSSRRSSKLEANGSAIGEPNDSPNGEAQLEQKGKEKVKEGKELQQQQQPRGGIPSLEEARSYAIGFSKGNAEMLDITMPIVTQWHDARETVGWDVVKNGTPVPITDWQADLRNFARAYQKNERQMTNTAPRAPRERVVLTTPNGWGGKAK